MRDFSALIKDLVLIDLLLHDATFTWSRGEAHIRASRIDRNLFSSEWNDSFSLIKQVALLMVLSSHRPLMLKTGDWGDGLFLF